MESSRAYILAVNSLSEENQESDEILTEVKGRVVFFVFLVDVTAEVDQPLHHLHLVLDGGEHERSAPRHTLRSVR